MLDKAYDDKLIRLKPHEIVHFAPNPEEAIRWVEDHGHDTSVPKVSRRSSTVKRSSFYNAAPSEDEEKMESLKEWSNRGLTFIAGLAFGVVLSSYIRR